MRRFSHEAEKTHEGKLEWERDRPRSIFCSVFAVLALRMEETMRTWVERKENTWQIWRGRSIICPVAPLFRSGGTIEKTHKRRFIAYLLYWHPNTHYFLGILKVPLSLSCEKC